MFRVDRHIYTFSRAIGSLILRRIRVVLSALNHYAGYDSVGILSNIYFVVMIALRRRAV